MADEFDSEKCFASETRTSELSEVAIHKQRSDLPSPDHEPSKIGDSSKQETKSENTPMKNVSVEPNIETQGTDSDGNSKNCELGFAENSKRCDLGFAGGDSSKEPESNLEKGDTDFHRNVKNNELGSPGGGSSLKEPGFNSEIEETRSGDDLKSSELEPKKSESNLENGENDFEGNVKNYELGFRKEEAGGFNLGAEKTSTCGDFKNCDVGFAGGEKSKKLKKAEFKSPKKTNSSGNFKKREVGFSGGEKMKMWKKVNVQFHKESEHNTETQNTGFAGGNIRNCEVGFAVNDKTKKSKKASFQSHKESDHIAEKEETGFGKKSKKCEVVFPGGENTKKWKKKVVKFETPKYSKSNLENEDTNSVGNSKKSDSGFAGCEKTKKWKKVDKSELPKETESNLESQGTKIAGNIKKSSVPKPSPLHEVWKHPVSDDWSSFFDPFGVPYPGAANSFNHFNTRRLMGDSSMFAERFDNTSRVVDNMFWNMGGPLHNLGIHPWNVGVPLGNVGFPMDNVASILPWNSGLPLRYVGVPLGNVDNLNRNDTSENCALKFAVVDDTALIDTCVHNPGNGVRKENGFVGSSKPHKKRTVTVRKNAMNENKGNGKEMNGTGSRRGKAKVAATVQSGSNEKAEEVAKRRYSRKKMEALRFKNLDEQRKKWMEVRSGFHSDVASEYDGLIDCGVMKQPSSSVVPQQQLPMNRGILGAGAGAAYGRGINSKLFVH